MFRLIIRKPPIRTQYSSIVSNSSFLFKNVLNGSKNASSLAPNDVNLKKTNTDDEERSNSSTVLISASQIRPKLRVQDILKAENSNNIAIREKLSLTSNATIREAVKFLVEERKGSCIVISPTNSSETSLASESGEIAGIITARDLLKFIFEKNLLQSAEDHGDRNSRRYTVADVMTPREKLVYCSPSDSVRRCREIMFQCKVRNLPVIEEVPLSKEEEASAHLHGSGRSKYELKGLITMKMITDSSFSLAETGGKKGFIHNVTGRRGLPEGTRISKDVLQRAAERQRLLTSLDLEVGSFSLPHPFKRKEGVAMNRRLYGADQLSEDQEVCEDAHFSLRVHDQTYMCVADGVGSWRQFGVDPRLYSRKLVESALKVVESDAHHREIMGESPLERDMDAIHPLDVITDAWYMTSSAEVTGSSTICVATLDKKLNQLSYSNIGDCGLVVIRHIDSETAGYMRERQLPRHLRTNDLRIAYISQQQLRSFNLPYQLGFSGGVPSHSGSFETPSDADTASIPVMPGDIIILATDGLYDNLDLDEIVREVSNWERKWFVVRESAPVPGERDLRYPSPDGATDSVQALAEQLVRKAREFSLDKQRDSPFAILAKENDIMWGGGMPDDTTVIVARVVATNNNNNSTNTNPGAAV